jgi:hypothetical protein
MVQSNFKLQTERGGQQVQYKSLFLGIIRITSKNVNLKFV